MNVIIRPKPLKGSVVIPPSKSQSHRAIIAASLSRGKSVISNIAYSEDVLATIGAMEKLGAKFTKSEHELVVTGIKKISVSDDNFVECNESGSTLRFIIPIFALAKEKVVFTGKRSLFKRPMSVYEDLFDQNRMSFQKNDESIIISGGLTNGTFRVPGNISSQFISGLLFALPLTKGDSTIIIEGNLESKQYIDMTIDTLREFQVRIIETNEGYLIPGNQTYHSNNITVEGDYSQLAFFAVLGSISDDIYCKNIPFNSKQPDKAILDYVSQMGGKFEYTKNGINFYRSETNGIDIDVSQCPDIAPILGILGALSSGTTRIINASRLKMKESNRLLSTYETLVKLGVNVTMGEDYLVIEGKDTLEGGVFDSYQDHRIVMSVAVAASRASSNVYIRHAEAINKSYPDFFKDLEKLGAEITYVEE
ncbi:MAG: 3-phosphoshikimate 1-carboxyvinyltransferase [Candidatus Izemoplasmatales bacterium]